jgi:inorganic pyrophosphatase
VARPAEGLVNVYVELVPTDTVKFEVDKESGHLRLDRPNRFSSQCPMLYGFVPRTYCGARVGARCSERVGEPGILGDGDPVDICVLTERTVTQGNFLARARVIGGMRMIDRNEADDKLIAVLDSDAAFGSFQDIGDCPDVLLKRLHHYFLTYKMGPEDRTPPVRIAEIYGREEAEEVLRLTELDYADTWFPTAIP